MELIKSLFSADIFSWKLVFYIGVGVLAQLVDGAMGMAYGLIATSVLLALGNPPSIASASVHAAEIVTTGLAGGSHVYHKNVDWDLFKRLAPAGVVGGIVGALLLTIVPETPIKIFVTLYLLAMTALIARRVYMNTRKRDHNVPTVPIGLAGGFFDAMGGGGWGPVVTSTLITRGEKARFSIGSVSLSEFFVTMAVSIAFVSQLEIGKYAQIVLGLIIGGAVAAPFAGYFSKILPQRVLTIMVAIVISILAVYNIYNVFFGESEGG